MHIDFTAEAPHFVDHILPVWAATPLELRGEIYILDPKTARYTQSKGVPVNQVHEIPDNGQLIVLASYSDLQIVTRQTSRPVVFMEHGAGQSYGGNHPSYAGGPNREAVRLFLVPGPHPAKRNRQAYPQTPTVEIGCPKMDAWHKGVLKRSSYLAPGVVVISFHWECRSSPEAGSAWSHFKPALEHLSQDLGDWTVILHSHPRARTHVEEFAQQHGIPYTDSFEQVLQIADVYVADNSSTLFEFACATEGFGTQTQGRPVVLLNPPWFRKDVRHGLRFWEVATVGVQVDHPLYLAPAILGAHHDSPSQKQARLDAIRQVYTVCDGIAADRAVNAIKDLLSGNTSLHVPKETVIYHPFPEPVEPKPTVVTITPTLRPFKDYSAVGRNPIKQADRRRVLIGEARQLLHEGGLWPKSEKLIKEDLGALLTKIQELSQTYPGKRLPVTATVRVANLQRAAVHSRLQPDQVHRRARELWDWLNEEESNGP